jgi:small nuclear ribonucleoprotein D1
MKLVKFLQKLNREQVTIELKNGTVISGTVVGVDATMNAHLKKAKVTVRGKNPTSYATLSVRGSTVRAWLLPDGLNLDALLVDDSTKVCVYLLYFCTYFVLRCSILPLLLRINL